jgi:hypothetical protein
VKRLTSTESVLREAHRFADPMTGKLLEAPPRFDPQMLPHADWPVSPMVERAISLAISEAIDARLSLRDSFERVRAALEGYGMVLSTDEIEFCIRRRSTNSR